MTWGVKITTSYFEAETIHCLNVQSDFPYFSYNIVKTHLPIRISKLTPNHF